MNFGAITWTHLLMGAVLIVLLWAKLDGWGG
jgi:hypothetical protein